MKTIGLVSIESVTGRTAENLNAIRKKFGFLPNLYSSFANNPAFLDGYVQLSNEFDKTPLLSSLEKNIVLLTASVENSCPYCTAGYTTALKKMKASEEIIKAIRMRDTLPDKRQDALVRMTSEMVTERGNVCEATREEFLRQGYTELAIMDILTGVALKTMATYFFHIFPVEIDVQYQDNLGPISIEEAMK
jgi:uncharacterized peroxidase-related enzyme